MAALKGQTAHRSQRESGMPRPIADMLMVRVYYEDTDFSGVVYHASYLRFLERGRTECLRAIGFANRTLAESEGVVFAVRSLQIDYKAPGQMDDHLRVETRIEEVGGATLTFDQKVYRDDTELVSAKVRLAVLRGGRPSRLPLPLRHALTANEKR
jgi:acyl-CoA thioester hydrolase